MDKKGVATCVVCGETSDQVTLHYSRLLCNGCRAFFKRTVQGKVKVPQCKLRAKCLVNVTSRKNCKACRFQACLRAGVDKTKVQPQKEFSPSSPEKKNALSFLTPRNFSSGSHTGNTHPHHLQRHQRAFPLANFSVTPATPRDIACQSKSVAPMSNVTPPPPPPPPPPPQPLYATFPGNPIHPFPPTQAPNWSIFPSPAAVTPDALTHEVHHPVTSTHGIPYPFLTHPSNQFLQHPAFPSQHVMPMGGLTPDHVNIHSPFFQGHLSSSALGSSSSGQFQECAFSAQMSSAYAQIFHHGGQSVSGRTELETGQCKWPHPLSALSHGINKFLCPSLDSTSKVALPISSSLNTSKEGSHEEDQNQEEQTSSGSQKSDRSSAFMISSLLEFDSVTYSESKATSSLKYSNTKSLNKGIITDTSTPINHKSSRHGYSNFSISAITEDISEEGCEDHDDSGLPRDRLTSTPNYLRASSPESAEIINVVECSTPSPINASEPNAAPIDSGVDSGHLLLHDSNNNPPSTSSSGQERCLTGAPSYSADDNQAGNGSKHHAENQSCHGVVNQSRPTTMCYSSITATCQASSRPQCLDLEQSDDVVRSSIPQDNSSGTAENGNGFETVARDTRARGSSSPFHAHRLSSPWQFVDKPQRSSNDNVPSGSSRLDNVKVTDFVNRSSLKTSVVFSSSQSQSRICKHSPSKTTNHVPSKHNANPNERHHDQKRCESDITSRNHSKDTGAQMKENTECKHMEAEASEFHNDEINPLSPPSSKHRRPATDENDPPQPVSRSPAKMSLEEAMRSPHSSPAVSQSPLKATPRKKRCLMELQGNDLTYTVGCDADLDLATACNKNEAQNMNLEKETPRHENEPDDLGGTISTTSTAPFMPPSKASKFSASNSSVDRTTHFNPSSVHSTKLSSISNPTDDEPSPENSDLNEVNKKEEQQNLRFDRQQTSSGIVSDNGHGHDFADADIPDGTSTNTEGSSTSTSQGQERTLVALSQKIKNCDQSNGLKMCLDLIIENIRKAKTEVEVAKARKELELFYKS